MDGELVGGLYGICLGRMFFGESMFAKRSDASKIAFAALISFCRYHGVDLIDCQQRTDHLASLGGTEIPRDKFEALLRERTVKPNIASWHFPVALWSELLGS